MTEDIMAKLLQSSPEVRQESSPAAAAQQEGCCKEKLKSSCNYFSQSLYGVEK